MKHRLNLLNLLQYLNIGCLFLPFVFLPAAAFSQITRQVSISNLGINDGLSQGYISSIFQDKKGFMWFGTLDGLNRYDGYHFITYKHDQNNPFSISSNAIGQIFEDSHQRMWISTRDNGLNYFDRANRRFYHLFPGAALGKIIEDKKGNLWIDAYTDVICLHIRDTVTKTDSFPYRYTFSRVPIPQKVYCNNGMGGLYLDRAGNLYGISHTNLFRLLPDASNKKSCTITPVLAFDNAPVHSSVYFLQSNRTGKFYLFYNRHITEYADARLTGGNLIYTNDSLDNGSCLIDSKNRLWLSIYHAAHGNGSTERIDLNTHVVTQLFPSDADSKWLFDFIGSPYEDHNGTIWFKTTGYGLGKYVEENNRFYNLMPGSIVYHLKKRSDSSLSINGMFTVYFNHRSALRVDTGFGFTNFVAPLPGVMQDDHGNYWYNSESNSSLHKRQKHNNKVSTLSVTPGNFPYQLADYDFIAKEKEGNTTRLVPKLNYINIESGHTIQMYAGSYFLSYNIDSDRFSKPVPLHSPYSPNGTFQFFTDADGILNVADINGICRYNAITGQVRYYKHIDRDSTTMVDGGVLCFCNDPLQPHRYLWIGTRNGMSRMDKTTGNCTNFTMRNGLPNNTVYGILSDARNNLWLSTNKGLCRLHLPDFSVRNFDVKDGLPGNEFNRYAFVKMDDETLVFGGMNGITYFHPEEMLPLPPPATVLTDFHLFGKPVADSINTSLPLGDIAYQKDITLSYRDNVVTLEFAGMDFRKNGAMQYRYKLIGFDKDWNYTSSNAHEATYTNLDPGDYTFVAEASNTNNVWGKESEPLQVHILPLWWQTWWFKIAVAVIVLFTLYAFYRYRLNKALEVQRVRNRIASDLHDEIGSTLSAITLFSEMAQRQSETAVASPQLLRRINETSQKVTQAMRDIVWSVSTKNDSFDKMITHMHEHAAELLDLKGYELHFTADEKLNSIHLNMEKRQNLYLIYKEALNNIIKYADGKNVWISLRRDKAHLLLSLKDDGIGFDSYQENAGNGLQNMKNRAMAVHGSAVIHSMAGGGCEVVIKVPV